MTTQSVKLISAEVGRAAERLKNVARKTPMLRSSYFNKQLREKGGEDVQVYFKAECVQRCGVFKFRGAFNAVSQVPSDIDTVLTHSSGNHALALCKAAQLCNKKAHIVMPQNSSSAKQATVKAYGGIITLCDNTLESREQTTNQILNEIYQGKATVIHPYNEPNVIYGQGTMVLEMLSEVPDMDCILVPVGGGGMITGCALAVEHYYNSIRHKKEHGKNIPRTLIIGCEPLGANDAYQSKQLKQFIPQLKPNTVADGLRTSLGTNTYPIIADDSMVHSIFCVSDEEILNAMKLVYQRMKVVIEPSAGVCPAVLLNPTFQEWLQNYQHSNGQKLRKIGLILCGGNVDFKWLAQVFSQS